MPLATQAAQPLPTLEQIGASEDGKWLVEQLRQSIELSVQHVVVMAAIVRRLEELDIAVTIKFAPLPFLRKIAYGNMSPELYVRYEGDSFLLGKIGSLPSPDQDRLSAPGATVRVMEVGGDYRNVPVESLTRREIGQVFATGRIRSDTEQVGYLRERLQADKQASQVAPGSESVVRLSKKRKGIITTGPAFISMIELKHYYETLATQKQRK